MAHTTKVVTVMEVENKKTARRRGDVQVEHPLEEMKKLKGELEKPLDDNRNSMAAEKGNTPIQPVNQHTPAVQCDKNY